MGAGVGYEVSVPPLFSRSETNTDDMKKMERFFKEEEGRVLHTRHFNFLHCHVIVMILTLCVRLSTYLP